MDKSVYLKPLNQLYEIMEKTPNTRFGAKLKIIFLLSMNTLYEKRVVLNKKLERHPYEITADIIKTQIENSFSINEISFIENPVSKQIDYKELEMEKKHHDVFNIIWDKYSEKEFEEYIDRYRTRIKVNGLEKAVAGKKVIDLGCGNGVFCFACADSGAELSVGIDFGEDNIRYANEVKKHLKGGPATKFEVASVYELPYKDGEFDFAIQNGVFHHLNDEDRAIKEAARVLKPGGYFWYYTDGEGGISYDLWDMSIKILRDVPESVVYQTLTELNIHSGKRAHLTDGLKATYRYTSWKEITERMSRLGFGNFKRLQGGFPTDFDGPTLENDPYAKEKFGEGDLRVLAQKL